MIGTHLIHPQGCEADSAEWAARREEWLFHAGDEQRGSAAAESLPVRVSTRGIHRCEPCK